jgi:hypothetical protein
MHRGIEKMRLERAFLLEQLTKRTSTNVEDSDGSPSPPPTVRCSTTILEPVAKLNDEYSRKKNPFEQREVIASHRF